MWDENTSKPFNQQNLGIGVTHMRQVWQSAGGDLSAHAGVSVGYYRNSLYKDSLYVLGNGEVTYKATPSTSVGIGAQVGVVSGYQKHLTPAGQIYTRIETEIPQSMRNILPVETAFIQVGLIPPVTSKSVSTPATATLRAGFTFKGV